MSIDIVVAHYQENIDWINDKRLQHPLIKNIYLYTKSDQYQLSALLKNNIKIKHQYLPNVGRESHTYLTYCIDHYDDTDIQTVFFLQGNPFEHGINFKRLLDWIEYSKKDSNFFSKNFKDNYLSIGLKNGHIKHWKGNTEPCDLNIQQWFIENINQTIPQPAKIYFGANFCIPKIKILSRSKNTYRSLINKYLSTKNPEVGHFFERSWFYLFNLHI